MNALGASLHEAGVTFRVWAPRCRTVDVVVEGRRPHALTPGADGLFEATIGGVTAGARYQYRLDAERYRPDPVSRHQPEGVHGPSLVVDPNAFVWRARPARREPDRRAAAACQSGGALAGLIDSADRAFGGLGEPAPLGPFQALLYEGRR